MKNTLFLQATSPLPHHRKGLEFQDTVRGEADAFKAQSESVSEEELVESVEVGEEEEE